MDFCFDRIGLAEVPLVASVRSSLLNTSIYARFRAGIRIASMKVNPAARTSAEGELSSVSAVPTERRNGKTPCTSAWGDF